MWQIQGYPSEAAYIAAIVAHADDPHRVQQMWEEEFYWRRKRDRSYITIINEEYF